MIRVQINGRSHEFKEGLSILQALHQIQVDIPTLCHDERLAPFGGCRLCLVQVQGSRSLVAACHTPLSEGMNIQTHTQEIESARALYLQMMAEKVSPSKNPESLAAKEFYQDLEKYQLQNCLGRSSTAETLDSSHPYIQVDMSKCIHCERCVRICGEVQGQFVWHSFNRGDRTEIHHDSKTDFAHSSCVSCGACVDTCPTGSLVDKTVLQEGPPTAWTKTTCPYCGVGCEMWVGTRSEKIVQIRPAPESPVSRGHLCVKGRYAFDYVHSPDRITRPLIRRGDQWQEVSWDEALGYAADRLKEILHRHGPSSLGVLGSARATNEENYLAQKFARMVLETNNVDCCARVCHAPSAQALKTVLGTGAATSSFDDIERAGAFVLCGCNPTENHPIVGARIKQQVLRGAQLLVVDPRKTELAKYAQVHLALRPGTDIALLNSLAHVILKESLHNRDFIKNRVEGFEEFKTFVQSWTPARAAEVCGVPAGDIVNAARLLAHHSPTMFFHGLGVTEHHDGTNGVRSIVNLALLTGNLGAPGCGVNPLRGQNNVQGSAHMGCEPAHLTGYVPLLEHKSRFEKIWGSNIPTAKGLNMVEMMEKAKAGGLKALYAIGYDVLLTNPHAGQTQQALKNMDLIIVQDLFLNLTASKAHVFLPACSSHEKDGTFMNSERRIQRVRKSLEPLGGSKPDWQIICELAGRFEKRTGFSFQSPCEIWAEIRKVWPAGAGITYERISERGLQWPCPREDHPGTPIIHENVFAVGPRARLRAIDFSPTPERVSEEFPFLLMTGRNLYLFNAGTMTQRTKNASLYGEDLLCISPEDAESLNVRDGDPVQIRSRYGEAVIHVKITSQVNAHGACGPTVQNVSVI